jgi:hypothetical protein
MYMYMYCTLTIWCWHVCECSIGVDVRNGSTLVFISIGLHVVMGCIVLGRQINVDFTIGDGTTPPFFVPFT